MSEEAVVENAEVVADVPAADPQEAQAREQGWVPKEEWVAQGKDEGAHRSAKEFLERGELYKSIHTTRRELKQTQAALTALQRHHQFVFEKAHQKALADLKMERRMALREGDHELVEAVEDKMQELNQEALATRQAMAQAQAAAQNIPMVEFDEFVGRNQWYVQDQELRDEADALGFVYINKYGAQDKAAVLKYVESKMKQKYPEKLGVKRAAPSPTANGDRTARPSKNDIQLDELETKIMTDLVRSGTMTEAEYKAELRKAKGIK